MNPLQIVSGSIASRFASWPGCLGPTQLQQHRCLALGRHVCSCCDSSSSSTHSAQHGRKCCCQQGPTAVMLAPFITPFVTRFSHPSCAAAAKCAPAQRKADKYQHHLQRRQGASRDPFAHTAESRWCGRVSALLRSAAAVSVSTPASSQRHAITRLPCLTSHLLSTLPPPFFTRALTAAADSQQASGTAKKCSCPSALSVQHPLVHPPQHVLHVPAAVVVTSLSSVTARMLGAGAGGHTEGSMARCTQPGHAAWV